jgi:hypothetical protein
VRPENGLSKILDKLLGINATEKIEIWDWKQPFPGKEPKKTE